MSDRYDFANLSPIEFETLCIDLIEAVVGVRFESFAEGADGGIDGRHAKVDGDLILQAKHYKNSSWPDLQKAVRREKANVAALNPQRYFLLTSQPLTPTRKANLRSILAHPSVSDDDIWGRSELNLRLTQNGQVEKRNIKLWLSSAAVLHRLLLNDVAVFTEATHEEIERILKVYVANPSLKASGEILSQNHCLIISGPPGVGKTTLAQVLAAEYSEAGWELVSVGSIDDGYRAFDKSKSQIFMFDDFLGKIRLDPASLSKDDGKIMRFISTVRKNGNKRFVLTTRSYLLEAAKSLSEALDDNKINLSEMVLSLASYTRELRARILYNHLYHSDIGEAAIQSLLVGDTVQNIIDHPYYMPRIIQWMTDDANQKYTSPADYPAVFLQTLANPSKIWDKAFHQHIGSMARTLLYCMFFSKYERYGQSGYSIGEMRQFFDRAVVEFEIVKPAELRSRMFDDALREIKSSFVVINDDNSANFINPSVQDFLTRQSSDATVLSVLGRSSPSLLAAQRVWQKAIEDPSTVKAAQVARSILSSLLSQKIDGKLDLHELVPFVADLLIASGQTGLCDTLRSRGLPDRYWYSDTKLPRLIYELVKGKYSHLPHAKSYGRFLRREIFRLVSVRDEIVELETLADLAKELANSQLEMSDVFYKHFGDAADEAIDAVDINEISKSGNAEQELGEILDQIDDIELISSDVGVYSIKQELSERLAGISQYLEQKGSGLSEPSLQFGTAPVKTSWFSNDELRSMFSSLKR